MGLQESRDRGFTPRTSCSSGRVAETGIRTNSVSSFKDIAAYFDRYASRNLLELHGGKRLLQRQLALIHRFARPAGSDRVLDVGCGTGDHLLALRTEIADGIGIDLSPKMVETACALANEAGADSQLSFLVDDAQHAGVVASRSIDLVICLGALEHMVDKRAAIRNVHRVLRGGGRFFLLAPDPSFILYTTIAPWFGIRTKQLSTDKFCSAPELDILLGEAGFCRIERFSWSFVPKGDLPFVIGFLLEAVATAAEFLEMESARGGLGICAWKGKANAH